MAGITPRQRDALLFVQRYVERNGFSPSYIEIMNAVGLQSKSGVTRIMESLEARGFVARVPGMRRSIEVLRVVEDPNRSREEKAAVAYRDTLRRIATAVARDPIAEAREVMRRYP